MGTKTQAPDALKKHFSSFCMRLSARSSAVMKELAAVISSMKKSTKIDFMVEEMRSAVHELESALQSLSKHPIPSAGEATPAVAVTLVEVVPLVTASSLLIEIAARTEKLAGAVTVLAEKAEFEAEEAKKGQNSRGGNKNVVGQENEQDKTMMTLQNV